ncbi:TPA: hypothetical protein ACX13S_003469 [Citrobacter koseri]
MRRLKVKELAAEAHAAAAELPPKYAQLMRDVATRLEVTFLALTESLDQLVLARTEIAQLREGKTQ